MTRGSMLAVALILFGYAMGVLAAIAAFGGGPL